MRVARRVLTLVVDHDLNLAILHDTNTRVGSAQIDTNDGSRDAVGVVVLDGDLVLSAGCPRHHQTANEDEEKVEGDGPCRTTVRAPRSPRHCGRVCGRETMGKGVCSLRALAWCDGASRGPGYLKKKRE